MTIRRDDFLLELRNNLAIGLSIGVIGGGAVGLLMTATTLFLNPAFLGAADDLLLLTASLLGVYGLLALGIGLAGALLKTIYFLFSRTRLSDTKTAAFAMGAFFFLLVAVYGITWCRWNGVGGASRETLVSSEALPIYGVVVVVGVVLSRLFTYAMYILIVYWKKPHLAKRGDWRKAFFVLGYVALFTGLFMVVMRTTTSQGTPGGAALDPGSLHGGSHRIVLAGIDGMTRERMTSLAARGDRPALRSLMEKGAWIRLDPGDGLIPPVQWTSLATGQTYRHHGITDYKIETLRGLRTPLVVRPGQVGLYEAFNHVLPFFKLTRSLALRSEMRQSKALWDLVGEAGRKSVVAGWWATWPADKVRGAMVTDLAYVKLQKMLSRTDGGRPDRAAAKELSGETYPASLLLELLPLAAAADARARAAPPPDSLLAPDLLYATAASHLRKKVDPHLLLLYLPGPDVMKRVLSREGSADWQDVFDRWTADYADAVFDPLEELLEDPGSAGDPVLRALVLLPGWNEESLDGWLVLEGESVKAGAVTEERHGLADGAATLIHLLGLPVARDLGGRPVLGVLDPDYASMHPAGEIASYGLRPPAKTPAPPAGLDHEVLDRLRSLGYIGSR
jgi:hypothetical protein